MAPKAQPGRERGGERHPDRLLENEERRTAAKVREREDRADRQIDAAAQHDHGQAGHDDGELAELAGRILSDAA